MNVIQKILLAVLVLIVFAVAAGTAIAFMGGKRPGDGVSGVHADRNSITAPVPGTAVFDRLGTLRLATADLPPVPVVIVPAFPYPEQDSAFYEELSRKTQKMRTVFILYVASKTKQQLISAGEQQVKTELLALLNDSLILGKISELYFSEYMFLE